jgi:PAS domain S-box-containing protein
VQALVARGAGRRLAIERDLRAVEMKSLDQNLRLVLDVVPALICSGRPDSGVDYVNRRWLDEVGASPDVLEGWGWTSFIHPDDREELLLRLRSSLADGGRADSEARVRGKTGQYRMMQHRFEALRDEHGRVVRWIASSLDVSERKSAEAALRESERELRTMLETIPALTRRAFLRPR